MNPPDQNPLNINISAYRVLYILLLLVQYRSLNMTELNGFLYDNPLIQRIYNNETLTKYVNTLRHVGCRIPRASSKNDYSYELLQNPFTLTLDETELAIAEKLLNVLADQPDERLFDGYQEFLDRIFWSLETDDKTLESRRRIRGISWGALSAGHRHLLRKYHHYCNDGFILEIQVKPEAPDLSSEIETLILEPYDVLNRNGRFWLLGMETRTHTKKLLDLDTIISVRTLPAKMKRGLPEICVHFELYGRLAETYRPYAGEKIVFRNAGRLQVKAKLRETGLLIPRLLKYGTACRVLSPASVRETMRDKIESLLQCINASG